MDNCTDEIQFRLEFAERGPRVAVEGSSPGAVPLSHILQGFAAVAAAALYASRMAALAAGEDPSEGEQLFYQYFQMAVRDQAERNPLTPDSHLRMTRTIG